MIRQVVFNKSGLGDWTKIKRTFFKIWIYLTWFWKVTVFTKFWYSMKASFSHKAWQEKACANNVNVYTVLNTVYYNTVYKSVLKKCSEKYNNVEVQNIGVWYREMPKRARFSIYSTFCLTRQTETENSVNSCYQSEIPLSWHTHERASCNFNCWIWPMS